MKLKSFRRNCSQLGVAQFEMSTRCFTTLKTASLCQWKQLVLTPFQMPFTDWKYIENLIDIRRFLHLFKM